MGSRKVSPRCYRGEKVGGGAGERRKRRPRSGRVDGAEAGRGVDPTSPCSLGSSFPGLPLKQRTRPADHGPAVPRNSKGTQTKTADPEEKERKKDLREDGGRQATFAPVALAPLSPSITSSSLEKTKAGRSPVPGRGCSQPQPGLGGGCWWAEGADSAIHEKNRRGSGARCSKAEERPRGRCVCTGAARGSAGLAWLLAWRYRVPRDFRQALTFPFLHRDSRRT